MRAVVTVPDPRDPVPEVAPVVEREPIVVDIARDDRAGVEIEIPRVEVA